MKSIKQLSVITVFIMPLVSFSIMAGESNSTSPSDNSGTDTYIKAGGLCVGGAILGSFVPIFGNILGCAIGATVGYFWGDDEVSTVVPTVALET